MGTQTATKLKINTEETVPFFHGNTISYIKPKPGPSSSPGLLLLVEGGSIRILPSSRELPERVVTKEKHVCFLSFSFKMEHMLSYFSLFLFLKSTFSLTNTLQSIPFKQYVSK